MNTPESIERLAVLEKEVAELRKDIKDLVDAWKTTTGVVKFVKLLATFIASVTAIYFFIRHGFTKQ